MARSTGCGRIPAGADATTGHATILGDDPLKLQIVDQAVYKSDPAPYQGRYPCGSLVHNGVWYYGTYCLHGGQVTQARRHHLQLAVAGAVRRLPVFHRFRQDLDADALHAGEAAVWRTVA